MDEDPATAGFSRPAGRLTLAPCCPSNAKRSGSSDVEESGGFRLGRSTKATARPRLSRRRSRNATGRMPFSLGREAAALPRELAALSRIPRRVLWFYARALVVAARRRDRWSLASATRPHELAK